MSSGWRKRRLWQTGALLIEMRQYVNKIFDIYSIVIFKICCYIYLLFSFLSVSV